MFSKTGCFIFVLIACVTLGCSSNGSEDDQVFTESHLVENSDYAYLPEHRLQLHVEHPEGDIHPAHTDLAGHGHDLIPVHISGDSHRPFCLEDSGYHLQVIFFDADGNELGSLENEGECLSPFDEEGVHYIEVHNLSDTQSGIHVELYSVVSDLADLTERAYTTPVNNQITDAITQTNVKVVGFAASNNGWSYYSLEPDIAVNYRDGDNQPGRVALGVTLMLEGDKFQELAEHMDPLLRETIVSILVKESGSTMRSASGREGIRMKCLSELRRIFKEESGTWVVKNVEFSEFRFY